ncbi:MAG: hypothetical protein AAF762_00140 [Pseudomonadota bacterium]
MPDAFDGHAVGLTSPAQRAEAITPDNGSDLTTVTRALFVGQSGNVRVRTAEGDVITFANMQGGVFYPIRVAQVFATGTTASDLVGLS